MRDPASLVFQALACVLLLACGDATTPDSAEDALAADSGAPDAAGADSEAPDTTSADANAAEADAVPPEDGDGAGDDAAPAPDGTAGEDATTAATVTVTFDPQGGQLVGAAERTVTVGAAYGALPEATKPGHALQAWTTAPEGAGTPVTAETEVTNPAAHTLDASWSARSSNVSFDTHGGPPCPFSLPVRYGDAYGDVLLACPVSDVGLDLGPRGYEFVGWATAPGPEGLSVTSTTPMLRTEDHTIHATYRAKSVRVWWNANHAGTDLGRRGSFVRYNAVYGTPPWTPARAGYNFAGWWTTADATGGSEILPTTVMTRVDEHEVWARWSPRLCEPGVSSCDGLGGARICEASGLAFGPTIPCGASESCDLATGACAAWTCTPGAATCDANRRSVCDVDGRSQVVTACPTGQSCRDAGVCAVRCGDGLYGPNEVCDDGNTSDGDGCSATCEIEYQRSCRALRDFVRPNTLPSGPYPIDFDGDGATPPLMVDCDMTSSGGGWTLVVAQFEANPAFFWDGGLPANYDPMTDRTLTSGRSFVLGAAQIPPHTQTAFGRGLEATFVDYGDFVYTTGPIARTYVTGMKSGQGFWVHRSYDSHYASHDPDGTLNQTTPTRRVCLESWCDALTFDRAGNLSTFDWAFAPNYDVNRNGRGFSMSGNRSTSAESYAWTVWVR